MADSSSAPGTLRPVIEVEHPCQVTECVEKFTFDSAEHRGVNCLYCRALIGPWQAKPTPETRRQPAGPNGAFRDDLGKARWDLLPPEALLPVLRTLAYGEQKYEAWNWTKGLTYTQVYASVLRHLTAWRQGKDQDPESGESHLAHAACNILFLLFFYEHQEAYQSPSLDDREVPKGPRDAPQGA